MSGYDDLLADIDEPVRVDLEDLEEYVVARTITDHAGTKWIRLTPSDFHLMLAELRAFRNQHARPSSPNGRTHVTYTHVCASCGTEFTSNRRAKPGRKSWCGKSECRKVAAAERAQAYRARQSGGE